jgi:hypothetical protein
VKAKQDPNADFGRLQTFAWLPVAEAEPADQRVNDRFIDRRIRDAVERDLQAKGYRPAASGPADFLLNYRLSTSPDDSLSGHGPGYARGLWGGWPGAAVIYDNYDVGTLYLAALDAPTTHIIWVGAARARLVPHLSEEKRKKRADAAVEKILASFPKR